MPDMFGRANRKDAVSLQPLQETGVMTAGPRVLPAEGGAPPLPSLRGVGTRIPQARCRTGIFFALETRACSLDTKVSAGNEELKDKMHTLVVISV